MPADLTKPFSESCCDGGICDITKDSCQPCGCDPGCKPKPYVCARHQAEKEAYEHLRTTSEN